MGDLGRGKFFRDTFAAHQADASGCDGFQCSAIVQAAGNWIPEKGIHVEKIVPQQLLDGMRSSSSRHVGVIFYAPKIKNKPLGTKPAFCAAERICGLIRLS